MRQPLEARPPALVRLRNRVMRQPLEARPPALVVGLCAHGLALVHALASRGVAVHAVESNTTLPGVRTRRAQVHLVASLRGPALIESLCELAARRFSGLRPVLLLTNDEMVGTVAGSWPELAGHYRLSWSGCRPAIGRLLLKVEHETRCAAAGCRYPATVRVDSADDVRLKSANLRFPAIAKPSRPLSSFKVRVLVAAHELDELVRHHADSFPIVVQPFIPGGDERIFFAALYLRQGKVIARFEGRKLRSRPMGHTTIAAAHRSDEMHSQALQFFDGLKLSGPVSLELKLDVDGIKWVMEPTVGRTDFWIGACVANGINFPWIEYCDQAGLTTGDAAQQDRWIWFNTERDPVGPLWYAARVATGRAKLRLPTFTYPAADPAPAWAAVWRRLAKTWRRVRSLAG
jgi:D-aspartate ligase